MASKMLTTGLKLADFVRPDCCKIRDPLPKDAECFAKDISKELEKLYQRHERMFVKRKRLMEMALPVRRRCRFVPKCACQFSKTIDIIPAYQPSYTRTEQLALPTVRRLLGRREYAMAKGDGIGESILNRLLRSSYLSMYSRLANLQPLTKPIKKKKKSKKQKARQMKYLEKMAKPKVIPKPPKRERKVGEMSERRLKKLSRPKKYVEEVQPKWELTDTMRDYKPTKRIVELAKHVIRENVHINEEPQKIAANALHYKPSARIKEMAQPLSVHEANMVPADIKEEPFAISPNALKYKASARIKELAEPKEFENAHIRDNPFAISPAALKATASPRLIELAKPKGA
ncbi:uncharacterized protein Theg [Drosophila tropicalis]|uniref:uncharacterized protein Theg n=1 Tax=Drosophila tropicalis TaxID=46794 RepID=UPI0035ABB5C1